MRGKLRYLTIAVSAAALLAGCGDDDAPIEPISTSSTTTTSGGTLSQDEFITSADARCGEANAALANLSTDTGAATTTGQERSITQGLLTGLQGIGDAEDPDGSLEEYYSALKEQVKILKQQESAIATGDTATADSLDTDLDAARSAATTAAESYGFEECGQEGTELSDTPTTTPGGVAPSTTPTTATPAPVTPTTATPTTPAPGEPVTPPATGGTGGTGGGTPSAPSGGGSSGGISPG
jgi:hypothetical protein